MPQKSSPLKRFDFGANMQPELSCCVAESCREINPSEGCGNWWYGAKCSKELEESVLKKLVAQLAARGEISPAREGRKFQRILESMLHSMGKLMQQKGATTAIIAHCISFMALVKRLSVSKFADFISKNRLGLSSIWNAGLFALLKGDGKANSLNSLRSTVIMYQWVCAVRQAFAQGNVNSDASSSCVELAEDLTKRLKEFLLEDRRPVDRLYGSLAPCFGVVAAVAPLLAFPLLLSTDSQQVIKYTYMADPLKFVSLIFNQLLRYSFEHHDLFDSKAHETLRALITHLESEALLIPAPLAARFDTQERTDQIKFVRESVRLFDALLEWVPKRSDQSPYKLNVNSSDALVSWLLEESAYGSVLVPGLLFKFIALAVSHRVNWPVLQSLVVQLIGDATLKSSINEASSRNFSKDALLWLFTLSAPATERQNSEGCLQQRLWSLELLGRLSVGFTAQQAKLLLLTRANDPLLEVRICCGRALANLSFQSARREDCKSPLLAYLSLISTAKHLFTVNAPERQVTVQHMSNEIQTIGIWAAVLTEMCWRALEAKCVAILRSAAQSIGSLQSCSVALAEALAVVIISILEASIQSHYGVKVVDAFSALLCQMRHHQRQPWIRSLTVQACYKFLTKNEALEPAVALRLYVILGGFPYVLAEKSENVLLQSPTFTSLDRQHPRIVPTVLEAWALGQKRDFAKLMLLRAQALSPQADDSERDQSAVLLNNSEGFTLFAEEEFIGLKNERSTKSAQYDLTALYDYSLDDATADKSSSPARVSLQKSTISERVKPSNSALRAPLQVDMNSDQEECASLMDDYALASRSVKQRETSRSSLKSAALDERIDIIGAEVLGLLNAQLEKAAGEVTSHDTSSSAAPIATSSFAEPKSLSFSNNEPTPQRPKADGQLSELQPEASFPQSRFKAQMCESGGAESANHRHDTALTKQFSLPLELGTSIGGTLGAKMTEETSPASLKVTANPSGIASSGAAAPKKHQPDASYNSCIDNQSLDIVQSISLVGGFSINERQRDEESSSVSRIYAAPQAKKVQFNMTRANGVQIAAQSTTIDRATDRGASAEKERQVREADVSHAPHTAETGSLSLRKSKAAAVGAIDGDESITSKSATETQHTQVDTKSQSGDMILDDLDKSFIFSDKRLSSPDTSRASLSQQLVSIANVSLNGSQIIVSNATSKKLLKLVKLLPFRVPSSRHSGLNPLLRRVFELDPTLVVQAFQHTSIAQGQRLDAQFIQMLSATIQPISDALDQMEASLWPERPSVAQALIIVNDQLSILSMYTEQASVRRLSFSLNGKASNSILVNSLETSTLKHNPTKKSKVTFAKWLKGDIIVA